MKGLLFGGCSFTWGQGLYHYSDLPKQVYPKHYEYNASTVTDAHIKFKDTIRYPRLVANHFNTFESFKIVNGGSEDETFDFFENIFNDPERKRMYDHISHERYKYEDFDYIIIQLSQLFRNKFYFQIEDEMFYSNVTPNSTYGEYANLLKWMELNKYTYDDWSNQLKEQQYVRLIKELKFYEEKGIKTKLICWEDDLLNHISKDSFLKERFIQIKYNNITYNTISELQQNNNDMFIQGDYEFFGSNSPIDHHPSKKCHLVIANSIIENLEKDLNK
jgi:hypothetical protein